MLCSSSLTVQESATLTNSASSSSSSSAASSPHLPLIVHPKRKAVQMLSNIFRKRPRDNNAANGKENRDGDERGEESGSLFASPSSAASSYVKQPGASSSSNSNLTVTYHFAPNTPVSPRVRSINDDMEALIISRQDNPFLSQKLELLSSSCEEELLTSSSFGDSAGHKSTVVDQDLASQALICYEEENEDLDELDFPKTLSLKGGAIDLHEHLIRSPPPQFPQRLSHFVFPGPGSPLRNAGLKSQLLSRPTSGHSLGNIGLGRPVTFID